MAAQRYQIVVKGLPQAEWAARLEEAEILPVGNDQFLLSEVLLDQPALHGLLDRIRAVGLELISVKFASADQNLQVIRKRRKEKTIDVFHLSESSAYQSARGNLTPP